MQKKWSGYIFHLYQGGDKFKVYYIPLCINKKIFTAHSDSNYNKCYMNIKIPIPGKRII